MCESRAKRYIKAITWFSALWGIKEFILEPVVGQTRDKKQEQQHGAKKEVAGTERDPGCR